MAAVKSSSKGPLASAHRTLAAFFLETARGSSGRVFSERGPFVSPLKEAASSRRPRRDQKDARNSLASAGLRASARDTSAKVRSYEPSLSHLAARSKAPSAGLPEKKRCWSREEAPSASWSVSK